MHHTLTKLLAAAAALALLLAACGDSDDVTDDAADAAESASDVVPDDADEAQSSLADLLRDAGAASAASAVEEIDVSSLTDSDEFTFLAPNDDAFRARLHVRGLHVWERVRPGSAESPFSTWAPGRCP